MPTAATIIIAREDFSIAGAPKDHGSQANGFEGRFFELVQDNRPDVIVLDLTRTSGAGLDAVRAVREKSSVPVLVVHAAGDPRVDDYIVCGAAYCVAAPIDFVNLNSAIHRIIELTRSRGGGPSLSASKRSTSIRFASILFDPDQNALTGPKGVKVSLTTLEKDILSFMAARPRNVCARTDIVHALYGDHPPTTDRAIDVIVKRLRMKLDAVDEERGGNLIKTEFRRGYILAADVTPAARA